MTNSQVLYFGRIHSESASEKHVKTNSKQQSGKHTENYDKIQRLNTLPYNLCIHIRTLHIIVTLLLPYQAKIEVLTVLPTFQSIIIIIVVELTCNYQCTYF